jgi:hypothetical protein
MPTVERLDHPARLEEIARAIVAGEPVGAYDAHDIRGAAAELSRLREAMRARGTPDRAGRPAGRRGGRGGQDGGVAGGMEG